MLPNPDSLSLPFKEGIRDLRCSIRLEARSGVLASRLFGTPRPTRRLARFADEILSQAEKVVGRVRPHDGPGLGERLDRLAAGLRDGRAADRSGDVYSVCRAILDEIGPSDALVSELKLAVRQTDRTAGAVSDPTLAAVVEARGMAAGGVLRRCLSTTLLPRDGAADPALDARIALTCWLAVLVRLETAEDAGLVLRSARLVVDAEGEAWISLLRQRRLGELAEIWRHTVPYLP